MTFKVHFIGIGDISKNLEPESGFPRVKKGRLEDLLGFENVYDYITLQTIEKNVEILTKFRFVQCSENIIGIQ